MNQHNKLSPNTMTFMFHVHKKYIPTEYKKSKPIFRPLPIYKKPIQKTLPIPVPVPHIPKYIPPI